MFVYNNSIIISGHNSVLLLYHTQYLKYIFILRNHEKCNFMTDLKYDQADTIRKKADTIRKNLAEICRTDDIKDTLDCTSDCTSFTEEFIRTFLYQLNLAVLYNCQDM